MTSEKSTSDDEPTLTRRNALRAGAVTALPPGVLASSAAANPLQSVTGPIAPTIVSDIPWVSFWGMDASAPVVRYGGDRYPSFVVTYDDDEYDTLIDWIDESDDRTHVRDVDESNLVVSAPLDHIVPSWSSPRNPLGTLNYIDRIDYNLRVSVDPISRLEPKEVWEAPRLSTLYRGDFSGTGLAFDDVEHESISDVRKHVGADSVDADGSGVVVGVVDTGCNNHENVFGERIIGAYNARTQSEGIEHVTDREGHGTWVASAIASEHNEHTGIAPGCDLLVAKALGDDGSGDIADIVDAINWCVDNGSDVINLSLGSPVYSEVLADAVIGSVQEGVTVVCASGNSRIPLRWVASPSDTGKDGIITVSATESEEPEEARPAYFAQTGIDGGATNMSMGETTGATVDVTAPGMAMTVQTVTSTGQTREQELSGTSMSTPVVVGCIALLMDDSQSYKGNPDRVHEAIEERSRNVPEGGVTEVGSGMIAADWLIDGTESEDSQLSARNSVASARDRANNEYAGGFADSWFTPSW